MPTNRSKHPACPKGSQVAEIVAVLLATAAVFVLAWVFPVWPGDEAVLVAMQGWESRPLTAAVGLLTYLGWYPVAAAMSLAAVAALLWRRRVSDALLLTVAVSLGALTHPLKALIGRPRPDFAIVESAPHTMGFPSGHAAFAMLLGGTLIYLTWQNVPDRRLRWALSGALALLILAVGLSRVYLGVHWPSDVLGGYLFGASVLVTLVLLRNCLRRWASRRQTQDERKGRM